MPKDQFSHAVSIRLMITSFSRTPMREVRGHRCEQRLLLRHRPALCAGDLDKGDHVTMLYAKK